MKLVLAIVHDDDIHEVSTSLTKENFFVTKLASTGGFLKAGNTTLICGVNDDKVEDVIEIIKEHSQKRDVPIAGSTGRGSVPYVGMPIHATVGGSTIFVLDVEQFIKV